MTLNRWQRIGVIISVIWAVGAGISQRTSDIDSANEFSRLSFSICAKSKDLQNDQDLGPCFKEMSKNFDIWIDGKWVNVIYASIIPIPIGWIAVLGLVKLFRWVKAGER